MGEISGFVTFVDEGITVVNDTFGLVIYGDSFMAVRHVLMIFVSRKSYHRLRQN